jgi:hypothetical protein
MFINTPPPPQQDTPAHIQYVDSQNQSPWQDQINNFDPDGPAPTITYNPSTETQSDRGEQLPNQREISEGMGPSEAQENKNKVDQDHESELANKNLPEQRPPSEEAASSSAKDNGQSDDINSTVAPKQDAPKQESSPQQDASSQAKSEPSPDSGPSQ